jgi:hypothetical protein
MIHASIVNVKMIADATWPGRLFRAWPGLLKTQLPGAAAITLELRIMSTRR